MGRTLSITVHSAKDLRNADADEGGISDPYVIVCFDNKVDQELGRTPTVENTVDPTWDYSFDVDITKHIQAAVDEGKEEPKMITFCVYDGDAGESEALGVAGLSFTDLVKKGSVCEEELKVFQGCGSITVSASLKKVTKSSMLTGDAAVKIAGGVAGAAAVGALGAYLYGRYQKKKTKAEEAEGEDNRTGMAYGHYTDSDSEDEENKGNIKKWWQMDDANDDDDDEDNRWNDDDY